MMAFKSKSLFFVLCLSKWQAFKSDYVNGLQCELFVLLVDVQARTTTSVSNCWQCLQEDDAGSLLDAISVILEMFLDMSTGRHVLYRSKQLGRMWRSMGERGHRRSSRSRQATSPTCGWISQTQCRAGKASWRVCNPIQMELSMHNHTLCC